MESALSSNYVDSTVPADAPAEESRRHFSRIFPTPLYVRPADDPEGFVAKESQYFPTKGGTACFIPALRSRRSLLWIVRPDGGVEIRDASTSAIVETMRCLKPNCTPTCLVFVAKAAAPHGPLGQGGHATTENEVASAAVNAKRSVVTPEADVGEGYVWVGFNDGSVRLYPPEPVKAVRRWAARGGAVGDPHVVAELPKAHSGRLTSFALAPYRDTGNDELSAFGGVDDLPIEIKRALPGSAAAAMWNCVCIGGGDGGVSVYDAAAVHAAVENQATVLMKMSALDATPQHTRTLPVHFTRYECDAEMQHAFMTGDDIEPHVATAPKPRDGGGENSSGQERHFSYCILLDTKPVCRLKGAIAGVKTMCWAQTAVVDPLPQGFAWPESTTERRVPTTAVTVEIPDSSSPTGYSITVLDGNAPTDVAHFMRRAGVDGDEENTAWLHARRVQEALNPHELPDEIAPLKPASLAGPREARVVDLLLTGDEEGRVLFWDLQAEIQSAVNARRGIHSPAPGPQSAGLAAQWDATALFGGRPAGGVRSRSPQPFSRTNTNVSTNENVIDFKGASIAGVCCSVPPRIPFSPMRQADAGVKLPCVRDASREDLVAQIFAEMRLFIVLADGSIQVVTCVPHVTPELTLNTSDNSAAVLAAALGAACDPETPRLPSVDELSTIVSQAQQRKRDVASPPRGPRLTTIDTAIVAVAAAENAVAAADKSWLVAESYERSQSHVSRHDGKPIETAVKLTGSFGFGRFTVAFEQGALDHRHPAVGSVWFDHRRQHAFVCGAAGICDVWDVSRLKLLSTIPHAAADECLHAYDPRLLAFIQATLPAPPGSAAAIVRPPQQNCAARYVPLEEQTSSRFCALLGMHHATEGETTGNVPLDSGLENGAHEVSEESHTAEAALNAALAAQDVPSSHVLLSASEMPSAVDLSLDREALVAQKIFTAKRAWERVDDAKCKTRRCAKDLRVAVITTTTHVDIISDSNAVESMCHHRFALWAEWVRLRKAARREMADIDIFEAREEEKRRAEQEVSTLSTNLAAAAAFRDSTLDTALCRTATTTHGLCVFRRWRQACSERKNTRRARDLASRLESRALMQEYFSRWCSGGLTSFGDHRLAHVARHGRTLTEITQILGVARVGELQLAHEAQQEVRHATAVSHERTVVAPLVERESENAIRRRYFEPWRRAAVERGAAAEDHRWMEKGCAASSRETHDGPVTELLARDLQQTSATIAENEGAASERNHRHQEALAEFDTLMEEAGPDALSHEDHEASDYANAAEALLHAQSNLRSVETELVDQATVVETEAERLETLVARQSTAYDDVSAAVGTTVKRFATCAADIAAQPHLIAFGDVLQGNASSGRAVADEACNAGEMSAAEEAACAAAERLVGCVGRETFEDIEAQHRVALEQSVESVLLDSVLAWAAQDRARVAARDAARTAVLVWHREQREDLAAREASLRRALLNAETHDFDGRRRAERFERACAGALKVFAATETDARQGVLAEEVAAAAEVGRAITEYVESALLACEQEAVRAGGAVAADEASARAFELLEPHAALLQEMTGHDAAAVREARRQLAVAAEVEAVGAQVAVEEATAAVIVAEGRAADAAAAVERAHEKASEVEREAGAKKQRRQAAHETREDEDACGAPDEDTVADPVVAAIAEFTEAELARREAQEVLDVAVAAEQELELARAARSSAVEAAEAATATAKARADHATSKSEAAAKARSRAVAAEQAARLAEEKEQSVRAIVGDAVYEAALPPDQQLTEASAIEGADATSPVSDTPPAGANPNEAVPEVAASAEESDARESDVDNAEVQLSSEDPAEQGAESPVAETVDPARAEALAAVAAAMRDLDEERQSAAEEHLAAARDDLATAQERLDVATAAVEEAKVVSAGQATALAAAARRTAKAAEGMEDARLAAAQAEDALVAIEARLRSATNDADRRDSEAVAQELLAALGGRATPRRGRLAHRLSFGRRKRGAECSTPRRGPSLSPQRAIDIPLDDAARDAVADAYAALAVAEEAHAAAAVRQERLAAVHAGGEAEVVAAAEAARAMEADRDDRDAAVATAETDVDAAVAEAWPHEAGSPCTATEAAQRAAEKRAHAVEADAEHREAAAMANTAQEEAVALSLAAGLPPVSTGAPDAGAAAAAVAAADDDVAKARTKVQDAREAQVAAAKAAKAEAAKREAEREALVAEEAAEDAAMANDIAEALAATAECEAEVALAVAALSDSKRAAALAEDAAVAAAETAAHLREKAGGVSPARRRSFEDAARGVSPPSQSAVTAVPSSDDDDGSALPDVAPTAQRAATRRASLGAEELLASARAQAAAMLDRCTDPASLEETVAAASLADELAVVALAESAGRSAVEAAEAAEIAQLAATMEAAAVHAAAPASPPPLSTAASTAVSPPSEEAEAVSPETESAPEASDDDTREELSWAAAPPELFTAAATADPVPPPSADLCDLFTTQAAVWADGVRLGRRFVCYPLNDSDGFDAATVGPSEVLAPLDRAAVSQHHEAFAEAAAALASAMDRRDACDIVLSGEPAPDFTGRAVWHELRCNAPVVKRIAAACRLARRKAAAVNEEQ